MFDSYIRGGSTSQSININAVTGAILKNHPKSWFERFHLKSDRAISLLKEGGHRATKTEYVDEPYSRGKYYFHEVHDPDKDIIILQMVICGDMEVMAELVYSKDYNAVNAEMAGADNG